MREQQQIVQIKTDPHSPGQFRLREPHLAQAHEEALIAGQAVDHRRLFALQRQLVRLVCDRHARVVADVFAQGQFGVDVIARQRAVWAVLRHQLLRLGREVLMVLRGPPVAQVAVAVVLRTLVVETVADLVADRATDGAVPDCEFYTCAKTFSLLGWLTNGLKRSAIWCRWTLQSPAPIRLKIYKLLIWISF
jgi:hypothetical protein